MTYAESRRLYGKENYPRPSRFLKEIPAEQLQEIRLRANVSKPVTPVKSSKSTLGTSGRYQLGQRVKHEKFGEVIGCFSLHLLVVSLYIHWLFLSTYIGCFSLHLLVVSLQYVERNNQ
jgi:hypothetical protein